MTKGSGSSPSCRQRSVCRHASRSTNSPEGQDQVGRLGDGDELAGHHDSASRAVPAHERLDPDDGFRGEVDLRLVVNAELAPLQTLPQLVFEAEQLVELMGHVRAVHLTLTATVSLGHVHGDIRPPDELLARVCSAGVDGNADAGGEDEVAPGDRYRLGELLDVPMRDRDAFGFVCAVEQHCELVSTEACEGVARPGHPEETLRNLVQQHVPGAVTETVVDLLEPIEVDEEHGQRLA